MSNEVMTLEEQNQILAKLKEIAQGAEFVTAKELKQQRFAPWLETLLKKDVGYPEALQSRVLQTLRNNCRITMDNGRYHVIG